MIGSIMLVESICPVDFDSTVETQGGLLGSIQLALKLSPLDRLTKIDTSYPPRALK